VLNNRITLKDIALKASVHPTTVSMALRNHPELPEATRLRLQGLAKEMGYAPDPVLSALNAYRLSTQRRAFQGVVAWIDATPYRCRRHDHSEHWNSISRYCAELGYTLEEFWLKEKGMSGKVLSRILRERGIKGLVISPLHAGRGHLSLKWEWFSTVSISYSLAQPQMHLVTPAQYSGMMDIMRALRHRGYQRPGLVVNQNEHERTDRLRVASFLVNQHEWPTKSRLPVLIQEDADRKQFYAWLKKYKPDVVIGQHMQLSEWLRASGYRVPEDIGLAGVTVPKDGPYSGHTENIDSMGRVAVEWLSGMIQRGERGCPSSPVRVLIPGTWTEGTTLRS
jgi:DNA-binding LacI/PurR family transcriptional regulator